MIPHVLLYVTVTYSVLVLLEKYERVEILGDDFQIRFCTQSLAWFKSGTVHASTVPLLGSVAPFPSRKSVIPA